MTDSVKRQSNTDLALILAGVATALSIIYTVIRITFPMRRLLERAGGILIGILIFLSIFYQSRGVGSGSNWAILFSLYIVSTIISLSPYYLITRLKLRKEWIGKRAWRDNVFKEMREVHGEFKKDIEAAMNSEAGKYVLYQKWVGKIIPGTNEKLTEEKLDEIVHESGV